MSNIFAGSEIVEMAVQIEKNGRDFYNILIENSIEQKSKEVFTFLAGEEERHISVFTRILENTRRYEPLEAYPEDYFAYLKALAGDHVFTKPGTGKELAAKVTSDKGAIDMGIGFEKDSILFYEAMKRIVPKSDQKAVDALIDQEKKHFKQLTKLKSKI